MSTVVNTNLASLFAQNSLSNAQNNLATSVQRLSSGLRINSAKDDAAGLAIAQNMQSQINGTNQSIQNLNDATNLLQTADSSLSTIQDMLLRLKQLATQGYDGSLNGTQKMDILQQMQDLNNEINATATRTQFNGINLLSSAGTVDQSNSDIKVGTSLVNTPVSVDQTQGLGLKISATGTGLGDTAISLQQSGASGTNATASFLTSVSLDPALLNSTPGTYNITSQGDQLTMTGVFNGVSQSQTITINAATGNQLGGAAKPFDTAYSFSNFGLTLNIHQVIDAGKVETGTQLAAALSNGASGTSLVIKGQTGQVSNVQVSGTAAGTYQLSAGTTGGLSSVTMPTGSATGVTAAGTYSLNLAAGTSGITTSGFGTGGTLQLTTSANGSLTGVSVNGGTGYAAGDTITINDSLLGGSATATSQITIGSVSADSIKLTGLVNGSYTNQTLSVASQNGGQKQTLNFNTFGISMDVSSNQFQTGANIVSDLVAANGGAPTTAGQIVVANGANSNLQFQSGASSAAFIGIQTSNVLTGTSGAYVGSQAAMTNVGTVIAGSGSSNLGGLQSTDSTATWQAAFQKAAGYIDAAVDYISTVRSTYGSQMNRLSYISTNLTAQSTNLQQSKSAIMDTNFASETASLTKGQIMQQAATAMLAQANQMPNVILSLLK